MLVLVLVMVLCVALAVAVVLAVAVAARREGRDVLTPHGEQVVAKVKERSETVTSATAGRSARLASLLRSKPRPAAARAEAPGDGGGLAAPELPPPSGTANATG